MSSNITKTRKPNASSVKGHWPKKGERFINGVWVMPEAPEPPAPAKHVMNAFEQRNWLRVKAGWPPLKESTNAKR